jgi:hypothetical protein
MPCWVEFRGRAIGTLYIDEVMYVYSEDEKGKGKLSE